MTERKPVDGVAFFTMVACCALWGLQQVAVKVAADGITPLMQGAIRSFIAVLLLWGWARWRGIPLFDRDGTLRSGLAAGTLFAIEFVFLYAGISHTTASRLVVFVYLAPCLTALGLHLFVPGERLGVLQWTGIAVAFGGIVTAFSDGFTSSRETALGDLFGVCAAILWAATTVLIRSSRLSSASPEKTLFYQIGLSAIVLPVASIAAGEAGVVSVTSIVIASLVYQSVIVAFASFLAWFWLLTRYLAGPLAVYSFLTPIFGVAFGIMLLGERVSAAFLVAAAMVAIGIALVNRKA